MLADKSIAKYLQELSSAQPAPGGGAAVALTAAQSAALLSMVSHLTLGKKKYALVEKEVSDILSRVSQAQALCLQLAQEDNDAFQKVMEIWSRPTRDDSEKEANARSKDLALQDSAAIPMRLFRIVNRMRPDALRLMIIGNKSVQSDVQVALFLIDSCLRCCLANFEANLNLMRPGSYGEEAKREMQAALKDLGTDE